MSDSSSVPNQPEATRWHLIIGTIGLIYGILGVGMNLVGTVAMGLGPKLMEMGGFKDVPAMPNMGLFVGQMVVTIVVGLALIFGSIALLRRSERCVGLLQFWVVARLLLVVFGLVVGFVTLPAQVKYSKDMDAAVRAGLEERQAGSSKNMPPFDEERQKKTTLYALVGISVIVVAFPLFMGVLITNRKKRDEIASWSGLIR